MSTLDLKNNLEFEEFVQHMQEHVFDTEPDCAQNTEVRIEHVKKNNGIVLTGLTFKREDENIAPTIYLENIYEDYQNGKSLHFCIEELKDMYLRNRTIPGIEMNFFNDFSIVKDKIHPRVINTDMNQHMMDEMPHFEYGDLSIGFFVDISEPNLHLNGSIRVKNEHLAGWEITPKELLEAAILNDREKREYEIKPMVSVLSDMLDEDLEDLLFEGMREESGMYVFKNDIGSFGAVGMIYQDLLDEHAQYINGSFYVLPSSVHELILVSAESKLCSGVENFRNMVQEINSSELATEEVLSNNVYFYDKEAKALYRTDTGEKMIIVDNSPVIKLVVEPKDLEPKKESIKDKMAGYKEVVRNSGSDTKKTPDMKKEALRE